MAEGLVMRYGKVTNVDDPHGGGRIQVRTVYDNIRGENKELPWYIPLLPKMLHVRPKVGELVLVISMAAGNFDEPSFYVGPLISQEDKLFREDADGALSITSTGYIGWEENPRGKKGVQPTLYPNTADIAIEGRKDTGIQLKDEEVRVKAGVKVVDERGPRNNTSNPAFISLKYYPKNDVFKEGYKSTATIVADKINLISTLSDDPETEEMTRGEVREVVVDFRKEYTTNRKRLLDKAEWRLYVKDADRDLDVIPYRPVERAFLNNFFIINTGDLIPNDYYVDIRVMTGRETRYYKKVLRFRVVSDVTNRYQ